MALDDRNTGSGDTRQKERDRNTRLARKFILIFTGIGASCLFVYSFHTSLSWPWIKILGSGLLVAAASFAVGGLLGFLFGIPRYVEAQTPQQKSKAESNESDTRLPYRGNTNLEQISDWLTKIIVGVGLVELKGAPELFQRLAYFIGSGFAAAGAPRNDAISLSIVALFFVSGFFLSYLMARLFLQGALIAVESPAEREIAQTVNSVARAVASEPLTEIGAPIPEAEIRAGQKIKELSKDSSLYTLREQLLEIAAEYEQLRLQMPPGAERTSNMEGVVSKFRALAPSTYALLDEMAKGDSAGKRLAAIVMLELNPQPEYLEWLADRVTVEKPFLGYHASLALLYAAEKLGAKYKPTVLNAIARAQKDLVDKALVNTDRMEVLEKARKTASSQ